MNIKGLDPTANDVRYIGYDQTGIQRLWAASEWQAELAASEYMRERLDCRRITWRKLGKNGKPMLQGSFTVHRPV